MTRVAVGGSVPCGLAGEGVGVRGDPCVASRESRRTFDIGSGVPFGRSEADPMGETLLKKPPEGDFGIDSRAPPPESFEIECAPPGDLRLDDDAAPPPPLPALPDPLLFGGLVDVLVVGDASAHRSSFTSAKAPTTEA